MAYLKVKYGTITIRDVYNFVFCVQSLVYNLRFQYSTVTSLFIYTRLNFVGDERGVVNKIKITLKINGFLDH